MSDLDEPALNRAWPIIYNLISLLQLHVRDLTSDAPQRWTLLHLTRLAESLVRRWLVLKASVNGDWPTVRLNGTSATVPPTPAKAGVYGANSSIETDGNFVPWTQACVGVDGEPVPAPRFRLAESEPTMPVWVFHPATKTQAGSWWLERSGRSTNGVPLALPQTFNPANLQRRCATLIGVITDPDPHIRRMAQWLAAAAARREQGFARLHPLKPGAPPGASKRQRRRDPERQNMLFWLDHLAREAVVRCGSP
ncbi:MAG: hypothetical protein AAFN91_17690 [Pseudomonadota bacterium]